MPINPRIVHKVNTPCSLNIITSHSLLQDGSHILEGISPVWRPLPGKAIKASLFYLTQNCVSTFLFITSAQRWSFSNIYFYLFVLKFIFNWRIIAYNVVLVSPLQKCESSIYIYVIYSLPFEPLSHYPNSFSGLSQSTKLSSLCFTAASDLLSIVYLIVYLCQCYFLNSSHSLLPPCVHKSDLYACILFQPCK